MYICHLCTYVSTVHITYVHTYINIYTPVCTYVRMYVCMSIIYMYVCRCRYVRMSDQYKCLLENLNSFPFIDPEEG